MKERKKEREKKTTEEDIFSKIRNFFLTSPIFLQRAVVVTKSLVSGILFSTLLLFLFKTVVLTSGIFWQLLFFFSKPCLSVLH